MMSEGTLRNELHQKELNHLRLQEGRIVPALAVAMLGLDLIAKGTCCDGRRDAGAVLEFLKTKYGVTPGNPV
jgi:hypothetical protein